LALAAGQGNLPAVLSKVEILRRLALIAAAFVVAGCALKRPAPPPVSAPPAVTKPVPPRPRPQPPAPQAAPAPAAKPTEACRSLALQRESDAKTLGRDAKAQRVVRDETFADCMSGKSAL